MAADKKGQGDKGRADRGREEMLRSAFIKERFSRYYRENTVPAPPKLHRREFGFVTGKGRMWRHISFGSQEDINTFLRRQVPLHGYHSSAYYLNPGARTMDEKGWLGADLIFDLDADHIPGAEKMGMEDMLAKVKVEFIKLMEEFLLGDFGFGEDDITIVFSGGRGYHAHVHHEKVIGLGSRERRQIVDFITYPEPDTKRLVRVEPFKGDEFKGHYKLKYIYRLYPPDRPGWRGSVSRAVIRFLEEAQHRDRDDVIRELEGHRGIGRTMAPMIYDSLFRGRQGSRGMDTIIRDLTLETFPSDKVRNAFMDFVIKRAVITLGGETDEPVTTDTKRLIRLPGTLHGKTSLRVLPLDMSSLRGFRPLDHAVWDGFGSEEVSVRIVDDCDIHLKGKDHHFHKDEIVEVPEYTATFLVCQKKARILTNFS